MVVMFMIFQRKLRFELQVTKITVVKKLVRIMRIFNMIPRIARLGRCFATNLTHKLESAVRVRIVDD